MLGVTRLISFGLTGLSTSGLSLYFVPKYFEDNSQPSQLIYKEGMSSSGTHVSSFENNEDLLLTEMAQLYENFKKATGYLENRKGEEYGALKETFRNVDKVEKELQQLYEENKDLFIQLEKWNSEIFKKQKVKLNIEAVVNSVSYYNELMNKSGEVMKKWGESVRKIICAIDNNSSSPYCEIKNAASSPSYLSNFSNGGGKPKPLMTLSQNLKNLGVRWNGS